MLNAAVSFVRKAPAAGSWRVGVPDLGVADGGIQRGCPGPSFSVRPRASVSLLQKEDGGILDLQSKG